MRTQPQEIGCMRTHQPKVGEQRTKRKQRSASRTCLKAGVRFSHVPQGWGPDIVRIRDLDSSFPRLITVPQLSDTCAARTPTKNHVRNPGPNRQTRASPGPQLKTCPKPEPQPAGACITWASTGRRVHHPDPKRQMRAVYGPLPPATS